MKLTKPDEDLMRCCIQAFALPHRYAKTVLRKSTDHRLRSNERLHSTPLSPLWRLQGDETGAKLAVRNGARINMPDEVSFPQLAASSATLTRHRRLQTGQTALIKAARHNNVGVLMYLLNNGADVNKGDNQGWTALFWASRMGAVACVKELMNPTNHDVKGCDYSVRTKFESRVKDIADIKVVSALEAGRKYIDSVNVKPDPQ